MTIGIASDVKYIYKYGNDRGYNDESGMLWQQQQKVRNNLARRNHRRSLAANRKQGIIPIQSKSLKWYGN